MKNLLTIPLLLLTLTATCQLGVKGGLNSSYVSQGDPAYKGIKNRSTTVEAGLYYRGKRLQIDLLYTHGGFKQRHDSTAFKPAYLQLPIVYNIGKGDFTLQVGGYVSRLLFAENHDFFNRSLNYRWKTGRWDWFQSWDYGAVCGFSINLHGASVEYQFKQGLANVRRRPWERFRSDVLWGSHNAAMSFTINVPFTNK